MSNFHSNCLGWKFIYKISGKYRKIHYNCYETAGFSYFYTYQAGVKFTVSFLEDVNSTPDEAL